jgi:hypothetical protein
VEGTGGGGGEGDGGGLGGGGLMQEAQEVHSVLIYSKLQQTSDMTDIWCVRSQQTWGLITVSLRG